MKGKHNWPALIEAFEGSGLTHAGFCESHNVSMASFQQRLYRSRKEASVTGFSRLAVVAAEPRHAQCIELRLPCGSPLAFPADVEAAYLAELLTLLRP